MIYLVRTQRFIRFDESINEKAAKLEEHISKNYPQVKDMKYLMNVTGPIDEGHWMLQFDSLADEEDWAKKISQDEVYHQWFNDIEGVLTPGFDRLYRDSGPTS